MRALILVVGVLLFSLAVAGCAGEPEPVGEDEPNGSAEEVVPEEPPVGATTPPGLYDLPDGNARAVGILTYRDLEGGFWAVVDTMAPAEAATAAVLAVVLPNELIATDIQTCNGQYVSIVGARNDGPSIYQAGPIVEATSIEVIAGTILE